MPLKSSSCQEIAEFLDLSIQHDKTQSAKEQEMEQGKGEI
jgi:hypothetical protein